MVKTITAEELEELNGKLRGSFGEPTSGYYSGCNYFRNMGYNEYQPVGTCTSMNTCDRCIRIEECVIKKDAPIWREEVKVEGTDMILTLGSIVDIVWSKHPRNTHKLTFERVELVDIIPKHSEISMEDVEKYYGSGKGRVSTKVNVSKVNRYVFKHGEHYVILPENLLFLCEYPKQGTLFKASGNSEIKTPGKYEKIGQQLGAKTDEKALAYGKDALQKSGDLLRHFLKNYKQPDGSYLIPNDLIGHICTQVRIMDKQSRIFNNPTADLMGENPYADIAGYAIQMSDRGEEVK